MNDTSPEIERKMRQMMEMKSPFERLKMGFSMYQTSRMLVGYGIRAQHPNISDSDFRKELFLKFYGMDYDAVEQEKIISHFESHKNLPPLKY